MAKFFGKIGYVTNKETRPGIWEADVKEKTYSGDIQRFVRRWQNGTKVNDDVNISAQISVIADSYLLENAHCIRYVKLNTNTDVAWEVVSIEPQYPRLLLDLGGVYNGETA